MLVRNALILGILAPRALLAAAPGLLPMLATTLALLVPSVRTARASPVQVPALQLRSPFSLLSALKFGLLFLAISVVGTLAQRALGQLGFYAVSLIGGAISSASAVASAALLTVHGSMPLPVAGTGAVLASLTSAAINFALAARISDEPSFIRRMAWPAAGVVASGIAGACVGAVFPLMR
jgi:uncharacterized membrane protein (DUF4010 family)